MTQQVKVQTPYVGGEQNSYWFKKAIDACKLEVTVGRYLEAMGVEVRGGRARCVVHDGHNPQSFTILDGGRRWYCHSCQAKGDVIDLVRIVEGHTDTWTALVSLKEAFGFDFPQPCRRGGWSEWQEKKAEIRKGAREVLVGAYQRRLFRVYGDVILEGIEDPVEREEEGRRIFENLRHVALVAANNRMARRG